VFAVASGGGGACGCIEKGASCVGVPPLAAASGAAISQQPSFSS
jgi:hypothetical protein